MLSRTVTTLGAVLLAIGGMLTNASAAFAQSSPENHSSSLSFELAFDMRSFLWSTTLAVAPDGNRVAYSTRRPPEDSNLDVRFWPNGTPALNVGSQLYVTDASQAHTENVCPGGSCWRPSWSPDGNLLAFYSDFHGPPQLWLYSSATGQSTKVTEHRVKAKLWAGDHAIWSPDGQTLYVPLAPESGPGAWLSETAPEPRSEPPGTDTLAEVRVLRSGSEKTAAEAEATTPLQNHYLRENNANLAAVDAESGETRVLVNAATVPRPSVLRLSPTGRWVSYLSVFKGHGTTNQITTIDLALVSASGGGVTVIAEDLPQLRDYHRLNYRWHPERDLLAFFKDGDIWLADLEGEVPPEPSRRLGAELGELASNVYLFTRDGTGLVVGTGPTNAGGTDPTGLAVLPIDGGPPLQMTLEDGWVFQDVIKSDGRTAWQSDRQSITVIVTERATGQKLVVRYNYLTGDHRVLWQGLAKLQHLSAAGRHGPIMGILQDYATPPNVYRFSSDFSQMERISHIEPRLEGLRMGAVEIFETTVPLYDGTLSNVRSAVLLPPGAKRGDRLPALVGFYPGSNRSTLAEEFGGGMVLTVPNLLFTSRGYAMLLLNVPMGPSGEPGNPMQEMVDGILPQIYRAAELGYVDVNRLALGGQSAGGFGTAAVVSGTNIFRAAIAVSGIFDLPGTYGHLAPNGTPVYFGWMEGGRGRMGDHPWANMRRYLENSPYYRADRIFTPLLIVHGTDDMAYHDAEKLFSALNRLDRPGEFASYGGQDHVVHQWYRPSAIDAARRMVEFLDRHLKSASDSTSEGPN